MLGAEAYPEMPRKKSKGVPEGSGPVPQDTSGLGGITMVEARRIFSEVLNKHLPEITDILRAENQRSADLEYDARQPRLTTEADVESDTKTRKGTEDAAADRVMNENSSSARRVHTYGQTSSTSLGMTAELPALPRRDNVMVDKGAEAPKPCISPVEMRTLTAAGGLLPAGTASTAMRTIFPRLLFFLSSVKRSRKVPVG